MLNLVIDLYNNLEHMLVVCYTDRLTTCMMYNDIIICQDLGDGLPRSASTSTSTIGCQGFI